MSHKHSVKPRSRKGYRGHGRSPADPYWGNEQATCAVCGEALLDSQAPYAQVRVGNALVPSHRGCRVGGE